MRYTYLIIAFSLFALQSVSGMNQACLTAGDQLQFIQRQGRTAIKVAAINQLRYHTYKAINALEETLDIFGTCGCTEAQDALKAGKGFLKKAAIEKSLRASRILIYQAMEHIELSMHILQQHQVEHGHTFSQEFINKINATPDLLPEDERLSREEKQRSKIDSSLQAFKSSLDAVIETVNCEEARVFIQDIRDKADRQLERSSLSPTQRYYQKKTRTITTQALGRLGNCP